MGRAVDIRKIVNANIRYYMGLYNMKQNDVAQIMGLSPGTMSKRMTLKDDNTYDLLELNRFARKCKCTVADLVTPKGCGFDG